MVPPEHGHGDRPKGMGMSKPTLICVPGLMCSAALFAPQREGLADILGIPKTVVALREAGASLTTIEAVTFGSAQAFFLGTTTSS